MILKIRLRQLIFEQANPVFLIFQIFFFGGLASAENLKEKNLGTLDWQCR
jgi:hypothetical protein